MVQSLPGTLGTSTLQKNSVDSKAVQLYKVVVFWATFIMYRGRYFYCSLLCAGNYILMQLYLSKLHIDAHQTV